MPPPESDSRLPRSVEKFVPGSRAPLEEHAFRLRQAHDGFHVVLNGIDEAGGALRLGLNADVEPHGRIESHFLLDEKMRQFVAEGIARGVRGEVAAFFTPADDRVGDAADQLPHRSFALGRVQLAVKIFRSDYVCSSLRPGLGYFYILLTENRLAFIIADQCGALFPFDFVVRGDRAVGKHPAEFQTALGADLLL